MPGAVFARSADQRSQGKEPRPLEFWLKVGGLGGMENHVAQEVVSAGAVPPSAAHERMVSKPVENAIAELALKVLG